MEKPIFPRDVLQLSGNECILTEKVFSQYQHRECFSNIVSETNYEELQTIKFNAGYILDNTLKIINLKNRVNYKRIKFVLRIPYNIITKNKEIIKEYLPDIQKDIIVFIPENARDELNFDVVVETSGKILGEILKLNNNINFTAGVFIIIKIVGRVQLYIPCYGYNCELPSHEQFKPSKKINEAFEQLSFPNFFPSEYYDLFLEESE